MLFFDKYLEPQARLFANAAIWLIFTAEFLHVFAICRDKSERRAWVWYSRIDILIIIGSLPVLPSSLQSLRVLRLGKATRLIRFIRLGRVFALTWLLRWATGRFRLNPVIFSGTSTLIALVVGANALHILEPEIVPDLGAALWWGITTVTTVGYGDIVPTTEAGRLVGVSLMIVGVAAMAAFSGALASYLVRHHEEELVKESEKHILTELRKIRAQLDRLESRNKNIGRNS